MVFLRKCFALLLALTIVLAALPALADSGELSLPVEYTSPAVAEDRLLSVPFGYDWFRGDCNVYSRDLALASLGMALSSFRSANRVVQDQAIVNFMNAAGFDGILTIGYDQPTTPESISTAMGYKDLGDFILMAVTVCGGGYQNEWQGNLTVGDETRHVGFNIAAMKVEDRIRAYRSAFGTEKPVVLWIAGFSRAAAVSNLTAGDMIEEGFFSKVFAYTFATPNCTREPKAYPNIFNIIGKNDVVPAVPFSSWGYGKNGICLYTPAPEYDSDYGLIYQKINEVSENLFGTYFRINPDVNYQLHKMLEYLEQLLPNASVYVRDLQGLLLSTWSGETDTETFLETFLLTMKEFQADAPYRQDETDELIMYLQTLLSEHLDGNQYQVENALWDDNVGLADNLMHEHNPDLYYLWLMSYGELDFFNNSLDSLHLVFSGKVDLEISDSDGMVETVHPNGTYELGENHPLSFYIVQKGSQTIVSLPRDRDYAISLKFSKKALPWLLAASYRVNEISGTLYDMQMATPGSTSWKVAFPAVTGDGTPDSALGRADCVLWNQVSSQHYSPSYVLNVEQVDVHSPTVESILGIAILATALLLLALLTECIISLIRHLRGRTSSFAAAIVFHSLLVVLFFALEIYCRSYLMALPMLRGAMTAGAMLSIWTLAARGARRSKSLRNVLISWALVLLTPAAFMVYTERYILGFLFLAFSGGVLLAALCIGSERSGKQWIAPSIFFGSWLSLCVLLWFLLPDWMSVLSFGVLLLGLIYFALKQWKLFRLAIFLLAFSALIGALYYGLFQTAVLRTVGSALYYASLIVMASAAWQSPPQSKLPESLPEASDGSSC